MRFIWVVYLSFVMDLSLAHESDNCYESNCFIYHFQLLNYFYQKLDASNQSQLVCKRLNQKKSDSMTIKIIRHLLSHSHSFDSFSARTDAGQQHEIWARSSICNVFEWWTSQMPQHMQILLTLLKCFFFSFSSQHLHGNVFYKGKSKIFS